MNRKTCMEITGRYYSKWLGQDGILLRDFKGVEYVYSEERNRVPAGYGTPFDLYVFCRKEQIVISYGDKVEEQIDGIKNEISKDMPAVQVKQILERFFEREAGHSVKYVFTGSVDISEATALVEKDYSKYESFWRKCHPQCKDTGWLKDYFDEMVQESMCIGIFAGDILVSCTDAPEMPYMKNEVQEIGINTLSEYRKRGYASAVCRKCLSEILSQGKVPQWSADIWNKASQKLAERVGFDRFGEVVFMTL